MRPRPLSTFATSAIRSVMAYRRDQRDRKTRRKDAETELAYRTLPREEPRLVEIASACKRVYREAHIDGGVMDAQVRLDELSDPNELLVTFRGSESVRDWLVNMFAFMVGYDGCKVHAGFLACWCSVDLQVVDAIDKVMRRAEPEPPQRIVIAGHSLGSAMATLCALDLRRVRPQYDVRLTTFAGPRVGDSAFAARLRDLNPMTICHFGDVVPSLPRFSVIARSTYSPCGLVKFAPPETCKNFIDKHRMDGFLLTADAIHASARCER